MDDKGRNVSESYVKVAIESLKSRHPVILVENTSRNILDRGEGRLGTIMNELKTQGREFVAKKLVEELAIAILKSRHPEISGQSIINNPKSKFNKMIDIMLNREHKSNLVKELLTIRQILANEYNIDLNDPNVIGTGDRALVLGGGGAKGVGYGLVPKGLTDEGFMDGVTHCIGSSAGAITAMCIATGITPDDFYKFTMNNAKNKKEMAPHSLYNDGVALERVLLKRLKYNLESLKAVDANKTNNIIEQKIKKIELALFKETLSKGRLGAIFNRAKAFKTDGDKETILKELNAYISKRENECAGGFRSGSKSKDSKISAARHIYGMINQGIELKGMTFGDLDELRKEEESKSDGEHVNNFKHLRVSATNQLTGDLRIFSSDNPRDKDILITDAVRASAAMPGLFNKVLINGVPYVDGGVIKNLPVPEIIGGTDDTKQSRPQCLVFCFQGPDGDDACKQLENQKTLKSANITYVDSNSFGSRARDWLACKFGLGHLPKKCTEYRNANFEEVQSRVDGKQIQIFRVLHPIMSSTDFKLAKEQGRDIAVLTLKNLLLTNTSRCNRDARVFPSV